MIREKIQVEDYAGHIVRALRKGVLLNTCGEKFNSMVIGWGHLGVVWGRPAFVVYVRENRFTKAQLDAAREFTVSVPLGEPDPVIQRVCGMCSGRDTDKAAQAGLTTVEPQVIRTPAVAQYPLTLECRVLYAQRQDLAGIPEDIRLSAYPQDVDGTAPLANRDPHTAYIGQIVDAYILRGE